MHPWGPLTNMDWLKIPAWTNIHVRNKVRGEITYQFPNFIGCAVEVWERMNNFTTLYNGCNYLSVLGLKLIYISKRGHLVRCIKAWLSAGSRDLADHFEFDHIWAVKLIKNHRGTENTRYSDVIMGGMASQITSLAIVYLNVWWRHHEYEKPLVVDGLTSLDARSSAGSVMTKFRSPFTVLVLKGLMIRHVFFLCIDCIVNWDAIHVIYLLV